MNYIDHTEIEARARRIAALKMGLVKDPDGSGLPEDLWRQCWNDALAEAIRDRENDDPFERGKAAERHETYPKEV